MDNRLVLLFMVFNILKRRRMLLLRRIFARRRTLVKKHIERKKHLNYIFLSQCKIPGMFFKMNVPRFRAIYKKPRSSNIWDEVILKQSKDSDFIEMFRMKKSTFEMLCEKLRQILEPSSNFVTPPVSVEKKVAVTLYKLASCSEYRVVGNMFGIHKSTVRKCFYQVVKGINTLKSTYIQFPGLEESLTICSNFKEMSKMENIIGSIDGTHIPILPPKNGYRDFINRKGWPSLVLQAVVDNMYRFRDVSIKFPGSAHDATVFKESGLFKNSENIISKHTKCIDGVETPLMLVGDPAYPLLPWLLKPYVGVLSAEEESFNCYLNSARIVVENAFGRLKARWRCVSKRIDIQYTFVPEVVLACCILHNILEENKEVFLSSWTTFVEETENTFPQPNSHVSNQTLNANNIDAKAIRENLKNYLAKSYPLRKSSYF